MAVSNAGVFLRKRPGYRKPVQADCFDVRPIPEPPAPGPDQVVVETLNFSIDPVLRFRMDEHEVQLEYMKEWSLGQPCQGLTGVGRVVDAGANALGLKAGDLVAGFRGWAWQRRQLFTVSRTQSPHQLFSISDPAVELDLYSYGISALTGYLAVTKADCVMPAGSQTAVVSTAAGSIGVVVSQVLALLGCDRIIGLTSTREKCDYLTQQLGGLSAALCYKDETFASSDLINACPKGVDIFVDLVGGHVSNSVRRLMRRNGHILSVGSISTYQQHSDGTDADDEETPIDVSQHLRKNKVNRHNYAVFDNMSEWSSALDQLRQWVANGDLKLPITRAHGLESTGDAFVSMMNGGNIGKQIVEL